MPLDLENPDVKAEVDAIREAAMAEVTTTLTEKYAGLEKNHEQVIADRKAASAKAKEAEETVARYKAATKDRDIDEIEQTFTSIEKADYKELLGQEKFDEAYEMRAAKERKEFAKREEAAAAELRKRDELIASRDEELSVLKIDKVAIQKFLESKGTKSGVRDMIARIRDDASFDEEGAIVFLDQFKNPRKNAAGENHDINSYIDEILRVDASHLFEKVNGSDAPGSKDAPGDGKKRSEMSSDESGKFILEFGQKAYLDLPA